MRPQYCTSTEFRWAGARSPGPRNQATGPYGHPEGCVYGARKAGRRKGEPPGRATGWRGSVQRGRGACVVRSRGVRTSPDRRSCSDVGSGRMRGKGRKQMNGRERGREREILQNRLRSPFKGATLLDGRAKGRAGEQGVRALGTVRDSSRRRR